MTRVDDTFIKELVDEVKHVENLFAFSEAFEDNLVGEKLIIRSGNSILLPKLFRPTVRKNCSSDQEKLLKFEAEG